MQDTCISGSDMLLLVNNKPVGHCTSHSATFSTETKERMVKAPVNKGRSFSLWSAQGVTKLNASFQGEGLCFYGEEEAGYKYLFNLWQTGAIVNVALYERPVEDAEGEREVSPYLVIPCCITNLEVNAPAGDDATYSVTLQAAGAPTTINLSVLEQALTESPQS